MRFLLMIAAAVLLLGCIAVPAETPAPDQSSAPAGPAQEETPAAEPGATAPEETPPAEPAPAQTTTLKNEEISYASGPWKIYGTLYESKADTAKRVVVLVPMLGQARDSYPIRFIEALHDGLPDALILAIDPRGHGKSTNAGTWQSFDMLAFKDMKTDILRVKSLLQPDYPSLNEVHVVGASIGSTSAINAGAQDKTITKVVMLSPGMEYRDVDITSALEDYIHPVLAAASSGDSYSVQSISDIESLASRPELEKKIYSGSAHGTDMFAATEGSSDSLENVIIEFLK